MKDVAALYRRLASEACHELAWRMPALGIRAEEALSRLGDRIAPPPATPSHKVGLWQLRPPEGSIVEWKDSMTRTTAELEKTTAELEKTIADIEATEWRFP